MTPVHQADTSHDGSVIMSVHPADRHPLWRGAHILDGFLQCANGLVDVIVDDLLVKEVPISLLQQITLPRKSLQTAVL